MTTTTAPSGPSRPSQPSRRERLREQTSHEIKAAARAQLIAHGHEGIQLRAVAREVGMTAPALYRYFPSLDDLTAAVTVDLFDELCDAMEDAAGDSGDPFVRMLELSRGYRGWAMSHPREFNLLFGVAPTALGQKPSNPSQKASDRFGNLFAGAFIAMWQADPFPVPNDADLDPALVAGLMPYWSWLTTEAAPGMPLGAVVTFLEGWVRLFGCVTMEVFGHLSWALADGHPMFEQVLRSLATLVHRPEAYVPPRDSGPGWTGPTTTG